MIRDECVLAIFAHPDDESLVTGGTLAACAAAGLKVVVVCATHGEQGPIARADIATRATLGAVRQTELERAAGVLGLHAVECLAYPDGDLRWVDESAIVDDLRGRLRHWKPQAVITFGPEGLYWHPDHIAIHRFTGAALDGLKTARYSPWFYYATWPKGWMAKLMANMLARNVAPEMWGLHPADFGAPASSITTILDVRPFLHQKLAALRSHRSQLTENHLFRLLPDDLAAEFLGREYFVRAQPEVASVDWLEDAIRCEVS